MITPIKYNDLGRANFGWLDARHHFSFGNYYNPERMGFGKLRVVNDDLIAPKTGFDTHPHQNMEIITYVRRGAITHKDSTGNEGRTEAGDVQVMSAGTGIYHSEHNREDETTSLYQIWIEPNRMNIEPRWDAKVFPRNQPGLSLLVGDSNEAPLRIYADAEIHAGELTAGERHQHELKHQGYLLVAEGDIELDGVALTKGDAAEISQQKEVIITAVNDSEVLLIDVAA